MRGSKKSFPSLETCSHPSLNIPGSTQLHGQTTPPRKPLADPEGTEILLNSTITGGVSFFNSMRVPAGSVSSKIANKGMQAGEGGAGGEGRANLGVPLRV